MTIRTPHVPVPRAKAQEGASLTLTLSPNVTKQRPDSESSTSRGSVARATRAQASASDRGLW